MDAVIDGIDLERLVADVLAGQELDRDIARAIVNWPDDRLDDLLLATRRVREAAFGRRVKLCMLRNAQSGVCPEACADRPNPKISRSDIPVYGMQSVDDLVAGARNAVGRGARRYCM